MVKRFAIVLVTIVVLVFNGVNLSSAQEPTATRVGEVVVIEGHVLDVNGDPIPDAVVEIWQADINGNYNHPDSADDLITDFQYFGTSTTDADGMYSFRTVKPAWYEQSRPPHIHVKVKINDEEVLTTQFYFDEDRELVADDAVFNSTDEDMESLILKPEDTTDKDDNPIRLAQFDLVVATDADEDSGTLALTPSQDEGPYYPVVDFSEYDNDLTMIGDQSVEVPEFTLLNLNTASGDDFQTILGVGNRMVREFEEYRPYISISQFRREIGKYVDDDQVAAYEAYVYVPIDVNESDAETLKQIPGVDDDIADELMTARPYDSNDAFLEALGAHLSDAEVTFAANYLEQK